jgi:hypothetical protein
MAWHWTRSGMGMCWSGPGLDGPDLGWRWDSRGLVWHLLGHGLGGTLAGYGL